MKFGKSIFAAAVLATLPMAALADGINGPYASIAGGLNIHVDPTYNVGGTNFGGSMDRGWAALAAVGYGYDSGFRGEVELGFRKNKIDTFPGLGIGSNDVTALTVMANLLYDIDTGGGITPYVGLGGGFARISADMPGVVDGSDNVLAGQGIAGVNVALSETTNLFVDYRYLMAHDPDFSATVSGEYRAHTVMAGLRFEFNAPMAPEVPVSNEYIVFFDFDESSLTEDAMRIIALAADNAGKASVTRISTTGHADRSGADSYNMGLSMRRAEAVKAELMRLGLEGSAIDVRWKGERDPMVPTADGVREPQNRRVVILFE